MDELANRFQQILLEEFLKPEEETQLNERQARRMAAYVVSNYVRLEDATKAVNNARAEEIDKVANLLLQPLGQRNVWTVVLDHLSDRLDDIKKQQERSREDNT